MGAAHRQTAFEPAQDRIAVNLKNAEKDQEQTSRGNAYAQDPAKRGRACGLRHWNSEAGTGLWMHFFWNRLQTLFVKNTIPLIICLAGPVTTIRAA